MQESLKVQLTRPALERLIGGDREMELILSDAGVRAVIETRLMAVTETVEKVIDECVARAFGSEQEVLTGIGQKARKFILSGDAAQAVFDRIKDCVSTAVHNYLVERRFELTEIVNKVVDANMKARIESETKAAVKRYIDGAVNELLKGLS